jgi:uncharacterized protein (DUF1501 family)
MHRRQFLRQVCCSAVGATGFLSTLAQLRVLGAAAAEGLPGRAAATPADYKALVCLFLNGGHDGTHAIIPFDDAGYAAYARARAEVAAPPSQLLSIAPRRYNDGRRYALHQNLSGLHSLFVQGRAAVVGNVGTLRQPTTLAQYQAGTALPLQLYSHLEQATQWQSSISDRPFETGWGGRLADLLNAQNENNQISMAITLSGNNSFQVGRQVAQFSVGPGGPSTLFLGGASVFTARRQAMAAALNAPQSNLLAAAFGQITGRTLEDSDFLTAALRSAPALATSFPGTPTGGNLRMVARLISIASALGLKRQVFFVMLHGFDTHGNQNVILDPLYRELGDALKAFHDATVELGVAPQVTTFTAADFGRTYSPNFGGTDHGWGNPQFVVGGAVQGGDIYGRMPSLVVGGPDDTGRGRWIPSTSVDEYGAVLARWFGVSATDLPLVFPNVGRFAGANLGFLG